MGMSPGDVEYLPPGFGADATTATPGFFSTPEDLLTAAQQTNAAVMALHNAIDASRRKSAAVPKSARDEWVAFATGWSGFYETNFSSRARVLLHWLTTNLQATLVNYQQQVSAWAVRLKKYGIKTDAILPAGTGSSAANVMMWIGIGVVTLAGLFIIGKLVHKVALGDAQLTEAENEAMQIVDARNRKKRDRTAFSIS